MAELSIHLFGPLEAKLSTESTPLRFPAQKTKLLLSYLLVHRSRLHSRERLAAMWWGDRETRRARHSLNTEIWRLRQALGSPPHGRAGFLISEDERIAFDRQSKYWLDIEEFELLCSQAQQLDADQAEVAGKLLQRAVALYRDDLLPDCYEEWCLIERQRLQQLFLFALARLASYYKQKNDLSQSIACYQRILVCDPLREEIHRELIRLYLSAARPNDALRQYSLCAAVLSRELGIGPMAETVALIRGLTQDSGFEAVHDAVGRAGKPALHELPFNSRLRSALSRLSSAAEAVAVTSLQLQQALLEVERLVDLADQIGLRG